MQNGGALKCAPGRSQKFDVGAGSPVRTAEALRESRGCGVEPQVNPARRGPGRGSSMSSDVRLISVTQAHSSSD
jgi:hypothetical protein